MVDRSRDEQRMRILLASCEMLKFLQSSVDGRERRPEFRDSYERLIQASASWIDSELVDLNYLLDKMGWPSEP